MRDLTTVVRGFAAITLLRRASALALVMLGSMPIFAESGCADQGEGERCTFFKGGDAGENGSNECSTGLVCTVTSYYSADNTTAGVGTLGVCCPPPGTASTAAACQPTVGGSTTGGSPLGDGGFDGKLEAANPDAAGDANGRTDASTSDATGDGTTRDATTDGARDGTADGTARDAPTGN